jgi:hypothetical protein
VTLDFRGYLSNPTVARAALWFGALGGPIGWTLRLLISYPLVYPACAMGTVLLLHLVTLVAALITLAAAFVSWQCRKLAQQGEWVEAGEPSEQRASFMAHFGVFNSSLFTLAILAEGLMNFLLDPCL